MKKIFIFLFIIVLYLFLNKTFYVAAINKININLKDNEIAIIFLNDNLLIHSNNSSNLILLNSDISNLSKFNIKNLSLMSLNKDIKVNIRYDKKYVLKNSLKLNNVDYSIDNSILSVKYADTTFCAYIGKSAVDNTRECNFLYLYNNADNINIDSEINTVFVNEKAIVSDYLLEDMNSKWIDIYTLKKNVFTTLKVGPLDYNIFIIPNI